MRKLMLRCLLICTVLLFSQGVGKQPEELQSFETHELAGMYIYLNTSAVTSSNLPECPQNISVQDNALQTGDKTHYSFNLASISISEEHCIYRIEENETVELRNHTIPIPMKDFIMWNMTIPRNILKCLPNDSEKLFAGGNFSFVPTMQEGPEMSSDNVGSPEEMGQTKGRPDYILVLENVIKGQVCTFFPEAHYKAMKEFIEKQFLEDPPWDKDDMQNEDEMKIGEGKSLKFCPICNCQAAFETDLDLDTIEMTDEDTKEMNDIDTTGTPAPELDESVDWSPPKLLVHDHKCPVSLSKKLEEVIGEASTSEVDHDDSNKETRKLVLLAVVNKLYDEIKGEYEEEWADMDFDMRKEMVIAIMTRTFRRRRVMLMKRGARCGKAGKPIDKDTVLIYEKEHILWQLQHHPFLRQNLEKVKAIRNSEMDTEYAFTLHVLRKKDEQSFSVCALSNSKSSCKLLNSANFCKSFKPLGSIVAKDGDTSSPGVPGSKPKDDPTKLGDKNLQDGSGDGIQSKPSKPGGKETTESGKDQGKQSPEPTTSPEVGSPSLTPSPSSSSSSSSGAFCFPAEAKVEVDDGRVIRMDALVVGDSIRDEQGGFSKVILFTHANKEVISEFVRLETAGADIVLSAQHYLPVDGKLMTAESVEPGNKVYILREGNKTESVVTKVERVWMVGLFNPQTVSSTLAVRMNGDAVVVSAYTAGIEPNIAHTLLTPLRMLSNLIGIVIPWPWLFKNGSENIVKMLPSGSSIVSA